MSFYDYKTKLETVFGRGFRWFGKLTWDAGYEQGQPHRNEIRRQVNVYLENPMEGW